MVKKSGQSGEITRIVEIYTDRFGGESRGIFGIEDEAEIEARKAKLGVLKRKIEEQDRGYEGVVRTCPTCGRQTQRYKGDEKRRLQFDCGVLEIQRAYYGCSHCKTASYPLDENLGLAPGQEQGHLREKLTLLGVIAPYHKAPEICAVLLGSEHAAMAVRRVISREARQFATSGVEEEVTLGVSQADTVYLQIDGHLCPTREPRREATDHGFREAKVMTAFKLEDVAEVSKDRKEILHCLLKGQITTAEDFTLIAQEVYERAHAAHAGRVVALADGAHWIWNTFEEIAPEAIQILDFAHAKSYLYTAGQLIYGATSDLVKPWVKQQEELLFEDKVGRVIRQIAIHQDAQPELVDIVTYLTNNQERMKYGSYQRAGLAIASGAIESAGKRLAQGRIKGGGMRWNVADLNKLLVLRCAFLDRSLDRYWAHQRRLAA